MRKTTASSTWLISAASIIGSHIHQAHAATYNVVPDPSSSSSGSGLYSLSGALEVATAGDTIFLADGTYTDQILSVVSGEDGSPITIIGGKDAVIQGESPSIEINHSWITLEGFSVDGHHDSADEMDSFVSKCVMVDGNAESEDDALEGFVMKDMLVQNCGGECVRLKNFVINSEITGNTITNCGVYDFEYGNGGENGEGIYVGTSYVQWGEYGSDNCSGNWIADNTIATYGNECVEVKEGSTGNIIEYNICSNQEDADSGCFCSRGDSNTIRYNDASECLGAGIRLGGWEDGDGHQHGQGNNVYGNSFVGADEGAMKVLVTPQGEVCGNTCDDGPCDIARGEDDVSDIEATWDASCQQVSSNTPSPVVSTPSPTVETQAPIAETPSPTLNTPAPTVRTPSPIVVETDSPSLSPPPTVNTLAPVTKTPSPTSKTPAPTARSPSPIVETPSPLRTTPSPTSETTSFTDLTPSPTSETPAPVIGSPSPVPSTPSPVISTPSPTIETPSPMHLDNGGDDESYTEDDDGVDDDGNDNYQSGDDGNDDRNDDYGSDDHGDDDSGDNVDDDDADADDDDDGDDDYDDDDDDNDDDDDDDDDDGDDDDADADDDDGDDDDDDDDHDDDDDDDDHDDDDDDDDNDDDDDDDDDDDGDDDDDDGDDDEDDDDEDDDDDDDNDTADDSTDDDDHDHDGIDDDDDGDDRADDDGNNHGGNGSRGRRRGGRV